LETSVCSRLEAALAIATRDLLAELGPHGHWTGELSSSALSTATAVVALTAVDREQHRELIAGGLHWLARHQNGDGGWGDTVKSRSNISTTALCWAALSGATMAADFSTSIQNAEGWLARAAGSLDKLVPAIERRYGKDRTFSVPILMHLAICGRVGWEVVPALPFELAAFPHQLFGALQLPVVSYALPALIAIGQAIHHHAPTGNPILGTIRNSARERTLRILESIQPENGGFLEATPLTSFVTMALASAGHAKHTVAGKGVAFLRASVHADGSWPIDTNLATWVTTLAIKALAPQPGALSPEQASTLREWLLGQQYLVEHPYTHAAPGGWAWTDLPGGVPDADDTPGALLALLHLGVVDAPTCRAGEMGVRWLLDLQNRDGGIPTFCRGWGALPFDRSSPDLTAHTLRAWTAWLPQLDKLDKKRVLRAVARGVRFLATHQRADGSWLPLWFGNEHAPDDENPVYGTAKVVIALRDLRERGFAFPEEMLEGALRWLVNRQDETGGWSGAEDGPVSVEETALAVEALAGTEYVKATDRGVAWLIAQVEAKTWREPAPIGFYFAKLWYYERLYPLIWTVGALGKAAARVVREAAL
jgi:squalene-hopene/tetraprenyl-beta-curcumene cyclase